MSEPAPPHAGFARLGESHGASPADVSRQFLACASLIVVVAVAVAMLATGARMDPVQSAEIRRILDTTTALCGLAVFVLCRATWRQIGDRAGLWAGAAALLVSLAAAARPELVQAVLGREPAVNRWLTALSEAATATAPVLFAAGLVPSLQRRRFGAAALAAAALAAAGVIAVVLRAFPAAGRALGGSQLTGGSGAGTRAVGLAVVTAWFALAVGYTVRGLHRSWLHTWAGLLLFALTLSALASGGEATGNAWGVCAGVLEALGMLVALTGCHRDLTRAYDDQSLQLFDSTLDVETAEVRERVRDASLQTRRHDLVNAVTAIDGAAMTLEREFERLSPADRQALTRLMGSGTARLRRLVTQESRSEGLVSLSETAAEVARDGPWGTDLHVDVATDLVGWGSAGETVEAVRQLLGYASKRTPGVPLSMRGQRDGRWVVLRVEDRGPTMPRELRRTVVDADRGRMAGADDSIGLRLAARLVRGHGGDLWVESRPGGGTSFGICLPAVGADDRGDRARDA